MLSQQRIFQLERLTGGEPDSEAMVLKFIQDKYGAKSLAHLSDEVAKEIVRRPYDFMRAVKKHVKPELFESV
jgi:hypothetical protein